MLKEATPWGLTAGPRAALPPPSLSPHPSSAAGPSQVHPRENTSRVCDLISEG